MPSASTEEFNRPKKCKKGADEIGQKTTRKLSDSTTGKDFHTKKQQLDIAVIQSTDKTSVTLHARVILGKSQRLTRSKNGPGFLTSSLFSDGGRLRTSLLSACSYNQFKCQEHVSDP